MKKSASSGPGFWLSLLILVSLSFTARAWIDDDVQPGEQPDACAEAYVEGIAPPPYLNGLPVAGKSLEIVGDRVKVLVATRPRCETASPSSLPFSWEVTGPDGTVTLPGGTLRPPYTPAVAGAYQARLTFCPNGCPHEDVGQDTIDIPRLTASFAFDVVNEIPLPPATQPVLTKTALTPATDMLVDDKETRRRKCAFPGFLADMQTPQLVPVHPWAAATSYLLLEGKVWQSNMAGKDNELNHSSYDGHDIAVHVEPDPKFRNLKVPDVGNRGALEMEVEWESKIFPPEMRPIANDRISAFGFHTYDCHHTDDILGILTEIHPPVLVAVHRARPIEIPDGWGSLGSDLFVPGIVTDVWASTRAGEMTSNCSTTGLHQEAVAAPPPLYVRFGDCIRSPHPIRRAFTFNIYLPEDPQKRMAAAGITAPPAPLYVSVEPPDPHLTVTRRLDDAGTAAPEDDVTYLEVTLDVPANVDNYGSYARRIVAGWVQPSPDNWGLERWKVGIESLDVLHDHDPDPSYPPGSPRDPGEWVLWASLNNRDREWVRLLDRDELFEGLHSFAPPFETEGGDSHGPRSLGPHLLVFNPRYGRYFPGLPEQDLTQSALIASSGYENELWDDTVGSVNALAHLSALGLSVGQRKLMPPRTSTLGDYRLNYFFERLGPVTASLWPDGRTLADAYTVRGEGAKCTSTPSTLCVLFPEREDLAIFWHPLLARVSRRAPSLAWYRHPIFEAQEVEEGSLTGMSYDVLARSVSASRTRDPKRAEQFFVELREEFDEVRGNPEAKEYARALPSLEKSLPADLWQLHFGDIDPTPVDLVMRRIQMSPAEAAAGQKMTFSAEIANAGTGGAAAFVVQLKIDGRVAGTVSLPGLGPGASATVDFPPWPAVPGTHTARVMADASARIAEPAEGNNVRQRRVVVP